MAAYYFNLNSNKYGAKPTSAANCVQKIYHETKFSAQDKLIQEKHFLPVWAENSPLKFFKTADKFEVKNAIIYTEFEFTLPTELELSQNIEIVDTFIQTYLPNKYYAYVIRKKLIELPAQNPAAAQRSQEILFCCLMFSERIIDKWEMAAPRTPQKFFSRYNSKNPELGGTKKDDLFTKAKLNSSLLAVRKTFVAVANQILHKYAVDKSLNYHNLVQDYADILKPISVDSLELLTFEHNTKEARISQKLKTIARKRAQLLHELAKLNANEAKLKEELQELLSFKASLPESTKNTADAGDMTCAAHTTGSTYPEDNTPAIKLEHKINFITSPDDTPALGDTSPVDLQHFSWDFPDLKSTSTAKKIITAYNAMQIKNLLTRLSAYLRTSNSFKTEIRQKLLARITVLKKAVNLQVIKDKYHTYSTDSNTVYYFVKNDTANDININTVQTAQFSLSSVSSEYTKQLSSEDLYHTKIIDLKNAKIIAEALAGNKQAETLVMQIKNDKIVKLAL